MARLSPFVSFGLVLAFLAWLWPFGPVFGLSNTLYNLNICEIEVICVQPSNCPQVFEHGLQESLQKLSDFKRRLRLQKYFLFMIAAVRFYHGEL